MCRTGPPSVGNATPTITRRRGSQGPITLHSEEHLVSSDTGIAKLRRLFEVQIRAIEAGGDPIGVHFEPGQEYVRLDAGAFVTEADHPAAMDIPMSGGQALRSLSGDD